MTMTMTLVIIMTKVLILILKTVMMGMNVVFVWANVVFAKLAIRWGWVGLGGWFWLNIRNGFEEPFNFSEVEYCTLPQLTF